MTPSMAFADSHSSEWRGSAYSSSTVFDNAAAERQRTEERHCQQDRMRILFSAATLPFHPFFAIAKHYITNCNRSVAALLKHFSILLTESPENASGAKAHFRTTFSRPAAPQLPQHPVVRHTASADALSGVRIIDDRPHPAGEHPKNGQKLPDTGLPPFQTPP